VEYGELSASHSNQKGGGLALRCANELGVSAERIGQGRCDLVPNRSLADTDTHYLEEGKHCLTSPSMTVAEQPCIFSRV